MYYLTYRPKTIHELDNSIPREIIAKILQSQTLPHALAFIGQKGTGKTSAARIFAKSVNCLKNKTPAEPCNNCEHCNSIDAGSFPDVIEMDAASNRGINEVKQLIQEAAFLPIAGRYRVFIIDEAHMITTDGFNALLKTLEEPPATVIFILATTNAEKFPKTIISRCIPVVFGKAKKEEIIHMLQRIIKFEKISVPPDLLDLIASHSDNSFRDAAKILEELVIQNKLNTKDASNYIGVRSHNNLLQLISSNALDEILSWINTFSQEGGSFKLLIEEVLNELQIMLINTYVHKESKNKLFTLSEITLLMKLLTDAYSGIKGSPIESIPLEIAIVEFYNKRNK